MLIVIDRNGNPLQRLGGHEPESGFIGIPSVIVTTYSGSHLDSIGTDKHGQFVDVEATFEVGEGDDVTNSWMEIAHTEWSTNSYQLRTQLEQLIQSNKNGSKYVILDWLNRKLTRLNLVSEKIGANVNVWNIMKTSDLSDVGILMSEIDAVGEHL